MVKSRRGTPPAISAEIIAGKLAKALTVSELRGILVDIGACSLVGRAAEMALDILGDHAVIPADLKQARTRL